MLYWRNILHETELQAVWGFQENQSFLHVLSRNYQFKYTAHDLMKAKINGWRRQLLGEGCEIAVNSVG